MELTQNELEKYPYVQKAVSSPGIEIKVPYKDEGVMENVNKFSQILQSNKTEILKVDDKYYNLHFYWAD